ncbi:hypothetical protein P170DRAFT_425327 [Aspergillus steynii IBT 23096]|uniref:PAC domain-containing protein n=1 Tax=Aspergillus steynii IBT 23096 TaxID=1392250 RepID=A0A2I2GDV0_9EURO|nr:uncharacterized protein P170DRAFT_425327 [Aspergillus steynii IBT 23096]PLB51042.1 hypothetical protein P170DRAFT_425327 [Aspergillus steynii IBT 23096]
MDTSTDAESLYSYASTVALDDFRDRSNELIAGFPHPPRQSGSVSPTASVKTLRRNFFVNELPLLQETNPYDGSEEFNPVREEGLSYDLIAPYEGGDTPLHSLERMAEVMFSLDHMRTILNDPRYLAQFREFLLDERPRSLSTLTYYLNACKALKAIEYANSLVRLSVDVPPPSIQPFDQNSHHQLVGVTSNPALERRVQDALQALTAEELPAFITSKCISITSHIVEERVRGTLPEKFQGTSDALAEVFCLTDPSRPDNPIIFASEEFHRTTQYGMDYVLGRNCRFLQGPKTNPNSVRRIREGIEQGRHHSELFLNYRRDGSPFMNLLQCAPLCDGQGHIRYFIGAQIDVSGLAMEGARMDSLQTLRTQRKQQRDQQNLQQENIQQENFQESFEPENPPQDTIQRESTQGENIPQDDNHQEGEESSPPPPPPHPKTEFHELTELFSPRELGMVQDHGGDLFQPVIDPRLSVRSHRMRSRADTSWENQELEMVRSQEVKSSFFRGSLTGVYENYLLVRPYPSLRVLFTSPSLQIPGMLQSSFLSRIGGSSDIRDELLHAMMSGRSVTARIKWVNRYNTEGRDRWVHCTPLLANNGEVGVWMVVIVDEEASEASAAGEGSD